LIFFHSLISWWEAVWETSGESKLFGWYKDAQDIRLRKYEHGKVKSANMTKKIDTLSLKPHNLLNQEVAFNTSNLYFLS
jgi:hypothetical protein